ncbi:MAG: hypothetical protein AAGG01_17730, partial [Planctomycetota bacterium]
MPAPEAPPVADRDATPAVTYPVLEGDVIDPLDGQILDRALHGVRQEASIWGPVRIETFDEVLEREKSFVQPTINHRTRNGRSGEWQTPSIKIKSYPHSGEKCLMNRWGDSSMGIGLGEEMNVDSVWVSSQGGEGAWAKSIRVVGFRDGEEVAASEWFKDIDTEPTLMEIDLAGVDRIVVEAHNGPNGTAFYALDDLALVDSEGKSRVIDFEDLDWDQRLTSSDFAGFTWETGTGTFGTPGVIPAPIEVRQASGTDMDADPLGGSTASASIGGGGTAPAL